MGVSGLWPLLRPVKRDTHVAECMGKKLAVDLSGWIVQCSLVNTSVSMSKEYLCCRSIFFRTLKLLSMGISLVFVLDGPQAPAIKKRKKQREEFYKISLQYEELLKAMGLPVVKSVGEAEKMCAELNRRNFVDGVLTNDGDALIYGALTIYKGLLMEYKVQVVEKYNMADVTSILGLVQRDLVAFALLSNGDFCDGVPGIGGKILLDLVQELKANNAGDLLDRFKTWQSNEELDNCNALQNSLIGVVKDKHCTKCNHEGTKMSHSKTGCIICKTITDCMDSKWEKANNWSYPPCKCQHHSAEQVIKPHHVEMKVRGLSLKADPQFPNQEVIDEFLLNVPDVPDDIDVSVHVPDYNKVCRILEDRIKFSYAETMSHIIPANIKMNLHGMLPDLKGQPVSIVKRCTVNQEECFLVRWQRLDMDEFTEVANSIYDIRIPSSLFACKYPTMVAEFNSTKEPKYCAAKKVAGLKRRPENDPQQTSLTDFFKVKK